MARLYLTVILIAIWNKNVSQLSPSVYETTVNIVSRLKLICNCFDLQEVINLSIGDIKIYWHLKNGVKEESHTKYARIRFSASGNRDHG
jgi:hypothetical protein